MCGTGDISVSDFKAHAVVIGGSWHFREKVSGPKFFQLNLYHIIQKKLQKEKAEKQICQLGKSDTWRGKAGGHPDIREPLSLRAIDAVSRSNNVEKTERENQAVRDCPPGCVSASLPLKEVFDSSRSYLCASHQGPLLPPGVRSAATPGCDPSLVLSPQVMRWFWTVVSSLTQEELARLLQFTTGSSQLPPGGFAALCPSFQIIAAPTHSTLPTAHTWWVSDGPAQAVTEGYLCSPLRHGLLV